MRRSQRTRAVLLGLMGFGLVCLVRSVFVAHEPPRRTPGERALVGAVRAASALDRPREGPSRLSQQRRSAPSLPAEEAWRQAGRLSARELASVPSWLTDRIEVDPDARIYINDRAASAGAREQFDPRHLAALQDIIDQNGFDEATSVRDVDDGDGRFEPLELGFQVWSNGELIALAFGPDPYWTFDYRLSVLPRSLGDLHRLQYLDVHANELTSLPHELGYLSELRELRAHSNALVELPDSFARLERLRVAHLARNELRTLPDSIARLGRLERLQLNDNPLVELPMTFGYLPALHTLGLVKASIVKPLRTQSEGSPFGGDGVGGDGLAQLPELLDRLASLDTLYVSGNRFGCVGGRPAELLADRSTVRVFGLSAQSCTR